MPEIKKAISGRLVRLKNIIKVFFSKEVFLVYQMGKVGSTSVYDSLLEKTIEDMKRRINKDIEYIENYTLFLDVKIILKTPLAAFGDNVY